MKLVVEYFSACYALRADSRQAQAEIKMSTGLHPITPAQTWGVYGCDTSAVRRPIHTT